MAAPRRGPRRWGRLAGVALGLLAQAGAAEPRVDIVFPTANASWTRGRLADFVQPTVSGNPESGLFGCVRSGGRQFHEGLDLKPLARDRAGEPTDAVFAAMEGIVRHVNLSPGKSSYGRYVVLEHPEVTPAVYTLYAHLARVPAGVRPGVRVRRGATIGTLGRSAGGYAIPRERAHLHFELGLRLTDDFQDWFAQGKFGSPNAHGAYNGMNLMGLDPLDFLRDWRARRVNGFQDYLAQLPTAVRLRIATSRVPDFITRYPSLLRAPVRGVVGGWEIECTVTGLPVRWTALAPAEVAEMKRHEVRIVSADRAALGAARCRELVVNRGRAPSPGEDLRTMLSLVFGRP